MTTPRIRLIGAAPATDLNLPTDALPTPRIVDVGLLAEFHRADELLLNVGLACSLAREQRLPKHDPMWTDIQRQLADLGDAVHTIRSIVERNAR